MSTQILFTLEGIPAGEGSIRPEIVHGQLFPSTGRMYFCPICSKVWFTASIRGAVMLAENRFCFCHEPGSYFGGTSAGSIHRNQVPGTVMDVWETEFNRALSPTLVSWELWGPAAKPICIGRQVWKML